LRDRWGRLGEKILWGFRKSSESCAPRLTELIWLGTPRGSATICMEIQFPSVELCYTVHRYEQLRPDRRRRRGTHIVEPFLDVLLLLAAIRSIYAPTAAKARYCCLFQPQSLSPVITPLSAAKKFSITRHPDPSTTSTVAQQSRISRNRCSILKTICYPIHPLLHAQLLTLFPPRLVQIASDREYS
jgi:hypothetical protein